jgi:hypothetical protein
MKNEAEIKERVFNEKRSPSRAMPTHANAPSSAQLRKTQFFISPWPECFRRLRAIIVVFSSNIFSFRGRSTERCERGKSTTRQSSSIQMDGEKLLFSENTKNKKKPRRLLLLLSIERELLSLLSFIHLSPHNTPIMFANFVKSSARRSRNSDVTR